MARYSSVGAVIDGDAIRLRFELDEPGVVGWQIYDPSSGAFLFEGQWIELHGAQVDLRVVLPREDGPYRVQVAPVADRGRFILIDALLSGGMLEIGPPRVTTVSALRRKRLLRAIPKAFVYPPRTL